jgi:hypothetical protein
MCLYWEANIHVPINFVNVDVPFPFLPETPLHSFWALLTCFNHAVSLKFAGKETHVPESSRPWYEQLSELL